MRRGGAVRVLPMVLTVLLFGAACGGDDPSDASGEASPVDMGEEIPGVEVTGEVGQVPEVQIDGPLELDETISEVVTVGDDDDMVVAGRQALLHLYLANGTSGEKALTSYDQGQPVALTISEDQLFPKLVRAIEGKPVGSRVALAALPEDAYGPAGAEQLGITGDDSVLFVADIISAAPTEVLDGPTGEESDTPEGLPTIEEADGAISGLSFGEAPPEPADGLELTTLIEGDGEPIRDVSLATMDYVGQVYGADKPFDNSFQQQEPATFTVGMGQLIPGWDKTLVGVKEGSRVLLRIPPEQGYGKQGNPSIDVQGTDTLVFLIDVLGVG